MSGISSNPADDFALAKIEKKETFPFREKILLFQQQGKKNCAIRAVEATGSITTPLPE